MSPIAIPVLIFASIVFVLVLLQAPLVIARFPKALLRLLCFCPAGAIGFFGIQAVIQHNIFGLVVSLIALCFTLYGGFTLQEMIPND